MAEAVPKPPSRIDVSWRGGERFDAGRPDGPRLRLDGTGETGQSPPDALLSALASCAAIDVVEILAKRRTPVERLEVHVTGERVTTIPRRFSRVLLAFEVDGAGVERPHAERAIDLSIEKYCSVRASLAPEVEVEWTLKLNGEAGAVLGRGAPEPQPAEG